MASDRSNSSIVDNQGEHPFFMPKMSKKMNTVEKYINEFQHSSDQISRHRKQKSELPNNKNNNNQKYILHHYRSAQITPYATDNDKIKPSDRCCIQYNSISQRKSQDRIEVLSKLQRDYSLLKNKMQSNKNSSLQLSNLAKKQLTQAASHGQITQQDLQKQIKNTIISQNGRKYYADLYLLKKGRQQIINSLSEAGKSLSEAGKNMIFGQSGKSYEQRNGQRDNQFIKQKMIEQRQAKKYKMLKGRNLHWNVYYDMLALSSSQKKKISSLCKFNSTFGIS